MEPLQSDFPVGGDNLELCRLRMLFPAAIRKRDIDVAALYHCSDHVSSANFFLSP